MTHEYYSEPHAKTPVPTDEHFVTRFLVKDCKLDFRVVAKNKAGSLGRVCIFHLACTIYVLRLIFKQIEPFFVSLALYDAAKGEKVSENFHMDLNDLQMQKMLDERGKSEIGEPQLSKDILSIGASNLNINEKWPVFIKQVVINI